jgi:hypothetical protein
MVADHRKDAGYELVEQLKTGRKTWQDIRIPFVGNADGKI